MEKVADPPENAKSKIKPMGTFDQNSLFSNEFIGALLFILFLAYNVWVVGRRSEAERPTRTICYGF